MANAVLTVAIDSWQGKGAGGTTWSAAASYTRGGGRHAAKADGVLATYKPSRRGRAAAGGLDQGMGCSAPKAPACGGVLARPRNVACPCAASKSWPDSGVRQLKPFQFHASPVVSLCFVHVCRLEQQVQQQQLLLDALTADLQQHSSGSSSSGGWRSAGAVRQQMMQRIQHWRSGGQVRQEASARRKCSFVPICQDQTAKTRLTDCSLNLVVRPVVGVDLPLTDVTSCCVCCRYQM